MVPSWTFASWSWRAMMKFLSLNLDIGNTGSQGYGFSLRWIQWYVKEFIKIGTLCEASIDCKFRMVTWWDKEINLIEKEV